jgi:hypothetical protein
MRQALVSAIAGLTEKSARALAPKRAVVSCFVTVISRFLIEVLGNTLVKFVAGFVLPKAFHWPSFSMALNGCQ